MSYPFTLYDSYLKEKVEISEKTVLQPGVVNMYSCGPTVYYFQHIGNVRAAWLPDTIAKTAAIAGWKVNWVSNITDVGHLVGDGDDGEDKLEAGAKRENKKVEEIVQFYTNDYRKQCTALHIDLPVGDKNPKATEYIEEQMLLALTLLKDNKAYVTDDGIYLNFNQVEQFFNTHEDTISPQLKHILATQKRQQKGNNSTFTGREIVDSEKKSGLDFALWKFVDEQSLQKWKFTDFVSVADLIHEIPADDRLNAWGAPGWHSECVCMISQTIGHKLFSSISSLKQDNTIAEIDIHTGGEDHIDVHHKNEIIQSEALGFNLSRFWVHNKFVMVDGGKMSKSLGNVYVITGLKKDTGFESIEEHGFTPLAYRLMLMEHHYSEQLNFTWEKLEQSQTRLNNLKKDVAAIRFFAEHKADGVTGEKTVSEKQKQALLNYLLDNLNTPKFVEKFQEVVTQTVSEMNKSGSLNARNVAAIELWEREFLQLDLLPTIPEDVLNLAQKRAVAKQEKNWAVADTLRNEAKQAGYQIDDYVWGWGVWKVG